MYLTFKKINITARHLEFLKFLLKEILVKTFRNKVFMLS